MPPIRIRIRTIMILVGTFAVVLGVWRFLVDVTNPLYFWDVLIFGGATFALLLWECYRSIQRKSNGSF